MVSSVIQAFILSKAGQEDKGKGRIGVTWARIRGFGAFGAQELGEEAWGFGAGQGWVVLNNGEH